MQTFELMLQSSLRDSALRKSLERAGLVSALAASALIISAACFVVRANLSTAGFLELLFVLLVALHLGLFPATVVSLTAFLGLNFVFTSPVFTFGVADRQNWIALFAFEATALLVSGLSSKVRLHAARAEEQRARAIKLYELSRAVLLIDQRRPASAELRGLIREIFSVDEVQFWIAYETTDPPERAELAQANPLAYETYLEEKDSDDITHGSSRRVLKLGTSTVGGMAMDGWAVDPLIADAVGSIVAISFARARSLLQESRAEGERDAEQLRAAVLDGLAHGFKTPLTAIQTASSGLLAIEHLSATQFELVSIIDERAAMLSQLTSRLLQTAALEAKQLRLRRSTTCIADLLTKVVRQQEEEVRLRIELAIPEDLKRDELDAPLIELALLQLVDNAAKYSAIGSMIPIMITQMPSQTIVVVQNETKAGASIRPEERMRIFERFYRGGDAIHGPSGTGLGLSIVKKIAEAHGGGVSVECSDQVTRFSLAVERYGKGKNA